MNIFKMEKKRYVNLLLLILYSTNVKPTESPTISQKEMSKEDQQWIENMLKNPKAKLFARTNFKGEFEEYSLKTMPENGGCVNFNKLIKTIKSVDTFGKCVRVFANRSCMGWSLAVYPGSGNSHGILSFKFTQIQSIGPCVQNEFKFAYFQDSKGIRENITKNSTDVKTYFPDLCAFSSVEKYRDSKQPPDNGSISWISLGPKNRVEYIRAHIYLKHLTANVPDGSEEEGKIFKSLDKQVGDSLGFVIPLSMGGVLKNFNVFPQSQANRAEWGELTFNLTSDFKRLSNNQGSGFSKYSDLYAMVTCNFVYSCVECTRPDAFYYLIHFPANVRYGRVLN